MATNFNIFVDSPGCENDLVPTVDPKELKIAWGMEANSQTLAPGKPLAVGVDQYHRARSHKANESALFIRVSMVRILKSMSESGGVISPWLYHGKPEDAVFKVVATFPMIREQPGVRRGLPFDADELIKQIRKEAKQCTPPLWLDV